jgi:hypothetical protein
MQIRIGLIPLITSTFVFYTWDYLATLPSEYLCFQRICFYQENYIFKTLLQLSVAKCRTMLITRRLSILYRRLHKCR